MECDSKGNPGDVSFHKGLIIQGKTVFWMSHTRKLIEDDGMCWDMGRTKQVQVGMSSTVLAVSRVLLTPGFVLRVVTVLCSPRQGVEVICTATAFYHVELKAGANADLGGT